MRPAHRSLRPALLFMTAFLLSSCGIPSTGVVEAGEPATGIRSAQVLYFAAEGTLLAVRRQTSDPGGVEASVEMVLEGPVARERAQGMTTELPRLTASPTVRTDGASVAIELPRDTGPLTATAVAQLICTAADARLLEAPDTSTASTKVTVTVPDVWRHEGSSETCPGIPETGVPQVPPENPAPSST